MQIFPTVSETFILNQITGLIDLGHNVDIYAGRPGIFLKYIQMLTSIIFLNVSTYYTRQLPNYIWRFIKAIIWFLANLKHSKFLLESLNFFKYGEQAVFLELFYGTLMFLKYK